MGIDPRKKVNMITKEERKKIVETLKALTVPLKGPRPIDEAIVTSGGVSTKEINPGSMQSKIVDGLYFAGEVIDVDAYTGGFNIQIALSTAYIAAKHISKREYTDSTE
jgi:predicted flavoprotein YhiN